MNSKLAASIGLVVGVVIGQFSIITAFNPFELRNQAFKLAGVAYTYGCLQGAGIDCVKKAHNYESILRYKLPIDR